MSALKSRLANLMGYEYCALFPSARIILARLVQRAIVAPINIPSNCCPVLATVTMAPGQRIVPVDSHTGMAPAVPVQLYGYREINRLAELEIDPLMTGYFGAPFAEHSIISFGRNKTLDINAGGALLTNDYTLTEELNPYFPEGLRYPLEVGLDNFFDRVQRAREVRDMWDRYLGDTLPRIPLEQIIPWRVMRSVPKGIRNNVVSALREGGIEVGTNYPMLSWLEGDEYDSGAIWGSEVINFWTTHDYSHETIKSAVGIIEEVIWND